MSLHLHDIHIASEPIQEKRERSEEIFIAQPHKSNIYVGLFREAFWARERAEEIGFCKDDFLREFSEGFVYGVYQLLAELLAALAAALQRSI